MTETQPGTPEQASFLAELLDAGLLIASGVPGVYGRGAELERILTAFDLLITRTAAVDSPERMAFPPLPNITLQSLPGNDHTLRSTAAQRSAHEAMDAAIAKLANSSGGVQPVAQPRRRLHQ